MAEHYVYHMVPPNFQGDTLYPLNALKDVLPDVYAEQAKKYESREGLMDAKIPTLDCLWNDVVHLSPIHPEDLCKELQAAGFDTTEFKKGSYFKIPISTLDPNLITVLKSSLGENNDEYENLNGEAFGEYTKFPNATREYYKECYARGEWPFLQNGIPHILYKGPLDTQPFEKIRAFEPMEKPPFV